ncbi:protein PTHB1 isoform X2 [Siphateles boraxobius]|uniref:protein PTHB1 isoform X2 n=1 Tax=Siphateles boraxobius TaxID=180520 RepID=UPI004062E290
MGMLRIFSPRPAGAQEQSEADVQLLELRLPEPVLQLELGKFVSCSELLHLAVLHPRKLSVYAVSGTAGNVEHGDQYQLRLVYEHNLQRTACNMTYGPFGGVTGHHFICIQSMDGMLMFFEQESYGFGRFLPGFLLPGPLSYCIRTDSFITVSSSRQVECYRYETLAVATDADTRPDPDQQNKSSGKRLTAEWTLVLGEEALDICVPNTSPLMSSIFVLGERNLFSLKDNGQIRFMKKLEFSPSCFLPYASVCEGSTNVLMCNHNNMLLVYQDSTLKWAAQLCSVPVTVRVANFPELKGVVVTLSSDGRLHCSYMGTDPSFFTAPKVEAREANYEELDTEMKRLQKLIREATKTQDIVPRAETEEELSVTAVVSSQLDQLSCALITEMHGLPVPSVSVQVRIKSRSAVASPKMTVCVQPPLAVTQDQFVLDSMGSGSESVVRFSVFLNGVYPPADLSGDIAVSYSSATELNPAGIPRVSQCKFVLPLRLVCIPSSALKNGKFKITIDTNKPPISLSDVFPDFSEKLENNDSALGFQFITGSRVIVLASKTSQRYRIQSESFEDMWLVVKDLVQGLQRHCMFLGVSDFQNSFSGPVPLTEYFHILDQHFQLRVNALQCQDLLSERAVQFRAIQRRLLTRFKDKTPGPLHNLDTLMEGTYRQVLALADAAEDTRERLNQAFVRLRSATHLLILLLSLWQGLNSEQSNILEATLLPLLTDTPQLGWEESVDAAVSHLLKTCLSRSPKDQAISLSSGPLTLPKDTARLKKHITLLCDRLGKGGRLSLSSEANTPAALMMPVSCESIPEPMVEQEEEALQDSTQFIKKKQPSKRVKSKSDSSKESSKEKKEKDSGKDSTKETKKDSGKEKESKLSSKESKRESKDKEPARERDPAKESGKEKKASRKPSVKVKEKKKSEAGDVE